MTIEEFKNYARIDYNDDDELIQSLIYAAIQYIEESTGKTFDENNSLHSLLLKVLVLHYYENRQAITSNVCNEVPFTITNLLTHIQMVGGSEE